MARTATSVSTACLYGSPFCIEGPADHSACQGQLATVYVPGFRGPISTLDVQMVDLGDGAHLYFSGDGRDGLNITPARLRQVVADVSEHLAALLRLADEAEALGVR